jgi:hypothetical protein
MSNNLNIDVSKGRSYVGRTATAVQEYDLDVAGLHAEACLWQRHEGSEYQTASVTAPNFASSVQTDGDKFVLSTTAIHEVGQVTIVRPDRNGPNVLRIRITGSDGTRHTFDCYLNDDAVVSA